MVSVVVSAVGTLVTDQLPAMLGVCVTSAMTVRRSVLTGLLAAPAVLRHARAQSTPIKVGMTQPLTGAVAASGNYVADGAKVGVEAVNARGGVRGRPLELILEDNKSNPREAVASVEKLVLRDRVPLLIGAWCSTFTLSIMPKLIEYRVPLIVETSSSSRITTAGNPWVFRISPTSAMETAAFLGNLGRFTPAIRKVDFLSVNNDFGRGAAEEFRKALATRSIATGRVETMTPDATDFSAQLAALKQSDGDTVVVTSGVEQVTLALKQSVEQRLNRRIITTGGSFPDQVLAQPLPGGFASEHILFFAPWFSERMKYPAIASAYTDAARRRGHDLPAMTEGFRGYDAVPTAAAALTAAGSEEPDRIREALWGVRLQGVNGDIAFRKDGPEGRESGQNAPNIYVTRVAEGRVTLL